MLEEEKKGPRMWSELFSGGNSLVDGRSNTQAVMDAVTPGSGLLNVGGGQDEAPSMMSSILSPEGLTAPVSPYDQAKQNHGDGFGFFMKSMLVAKNPALAGWLMPELSASNLAKHKLDMELYKEQQKNLLGQQLISDRVGSIDMENPTIEDIAYLSEVAPDLAEDLSGRLTANTLTHSSDHDIAEKAGVTMAQFLAASPEQKRQWRYMHGSQEYRDRALEMSGNSPDQIQSRERAKIQGEAEGTEIKADRSSLIGARKAISDHDIGLNQLTDVRTMISEGRADPDKFRRRIRSVFGVETREDGTMDAATANGIVAQIQQATFGALSQSELDLLRDGLMNPYASKESNLGRLDVAINRLSGQKENMISGFRSAADRLSGHEDQQDFLSEFYEDDWAYMNIGEGSEFKPIPKSDGTGEISFSNYVENIKSNIKAQNPYAEMPTRDEFIIGFNELREKNKAEWEAAQKLSKQRAEELERARRSLMNVN
jgi:hypothetical protein